MSSFETAAVLLGIAAACGYLNYRFLRMSATTGTLAIALFSSLFIGAADTLTPGRPLQQPIQRFLQDIDFNRTLMRGLLSFLLFAAALHVDLGGLWRSKWTIGALSTVGVVVSTVVIGVLTWWVALALSLPALPGKGYLLAATYAVVVFSILVQGLTMRRLLVHYHVGVAER